ncbi:MAG: hypothetical protein SFY80_02515 [Verrucomicrobiota bacterium]|nr:hypothetical protein [Verrucomicrobiota bacterium]
MTAVEIIEEFKRLPQTEKGKVNAFIQCCLPKKRQLRAGPSSGLPQHGRIIRIGGEYRDLRRIEAHPAATAAPLRPQKRIAYSARIAQFGSAALR